MSLTDPIFKPIFGTIWDDLPKVMHKHYANRPYCDDIAIAEGKMDVMCKWYVKPFFWVVGNVPAYNEKNIPVTVEFKSQKNSKEFCYDRKFNFKNRKAFHFRSRMTQIKGNEVMEEMSYGICWHLYYGFDYENVTLRHKGYSLKIGKLNINLPITWLIGRGDADEWAIDDDNFQMRATITHPLLGKIYEYKGQFKMVKKV